MTSLPRMLAVTVLSLVLLAPAAAVAKDLSGDDRATIRSTIAGQIEAFRSDDAALAYGYAAPGIKRLFPTAERFLDMVRRTYRPVYRPRAVTFGEIVETPEGILQTVYVTGPDGDDWIAAYVAERQDDGTWRISGCALAPNDGSSI